MATSSLPSKWRGRSGREYAPAEGVRVRHGGAATVRRVLALGRPVGTSTVEEGRHLALKACLEGDETSLDQLQSELKILAELASLRDDIPSPRLCDVVGDPLATALVMEWCPVNLERWWLDRLREEDAFGRLMATMAEVARRVSDYHVFFGSRVGLDPAHGDLKPTNILMTVDGRWVLSGFGQLDARPVGDGWSQTRVLRHVGNFQSPEAIFGAHRLFPQALDTWSLGALTFALLRLRRMVLDGDPIPDSGTHSSRFRMSRVEEMDRLRAHDPERFRDREIDPTAFEDPIALSEADRRAVRDGVRGVFGADDPPREERLALSLLDVIERATTIEAAHRYTDARGMAAAFEQLTRVYLELTAEGAAVSREPARAPAPDEELARRLREIEHAVAALGAPAPPPTLDLSALDERLERLRPGVPAWVGFLLVLNLLGQGLVVALLVVLLATVL